MNMNWPRWVRHGLLAAVGLWALAVCSPAMAAEGIAARLARAYPEFIAGGDAQVLIWKDGERMPLDDGRNKTFEHLLDQPDIQDQFTWAYPTGPDSYQAPGFQIDPGRVRYEPLFKKMYGASAQAVQAKLVKIPWMPNSGGKPLLVTQANGVDQRLRAVSDELERLPEPLKRYAVKTSGVFNWRTISGTKRLSVHAFGAALDLNTEYADYWKWDGHKESDRLTYKNQMPREIVEIFEKHGFIWGGKWYHYDTMHFEYRPELLAGSRGRP